MSARGRGPSGEGRSPRDIIRELQAQKGRSRAIGVSDFRGDTVQANTTGEKSLIAEFQIDTPLQVLQGEEHPFQVAIPAYENFTTDGTADNQETFSLANDIIQCQYTEDMALWDAGSRVQPDSIDYANDSFDYTSPNTNSRLDVFYIVQDTATLFVEKTTPTASGEVNEELYSAPLRLVHNTNQNEQPEKFEFNRSALQGVFAHDYKISVYVDASHTVKLEDGTNSTHADNALLRIPTRQVSQEVDGLGDLVRQDMADR